MEVPDLTPAPDTAPADREHGGEGGLRLHVRRLAAVPDADAAFDALFDGVAGRFWLDSSRVEEGLSRFSFLGAPAGPLGEIVSHDVTERMVTVSDRHGVPLRRRPGTLFAHLEEELAARRLPAAGLPFEFNLGYVGYLGYEAKADCGGDRAHTSELPDGSFVFADRMLAVDHAGRRAWLLALSRSGRPETVRDAEEWLARSATTLATTVPRPPFALLPDDELPPLEVEYRHDVAAYRELVETCQRLIGDGETYEVCLTNTLRVPGRVDPLVAYRALRTISPAPYAAYLDLPSGPCSAPRRSGSCGSTRPAPPSPSRSRAPGRGARRRPRTRRSPEPWPRRRRTAPRT